MAVKNRGTSLSMTEIVAEFGGSAPHAMSEYYAGAGLVKVGTQNQDGTAIPAVGLPISFNNFYGSKTGTTVTVITSSQNWTCPTGVTQVNIIVVGGGGGGGSARNGVYGSCVTGGGGGGAGGLCTGVIDVTPGTSYYCEVGAGGAGSLGFASTSVPQTEGPLARNGSQSAIYNGSYGSGVKLTTAGKYAIGYGGGGGGSGAKVLAVESRVVSQYLDQTISGTVYYLTVDYTTANGLNGASGGGAASPAFTTSVVNQTSYGPYSGGLAIPSGWDYGQSGGNMTYTGKTHLVAPCGGGGYSGKGGDNSALATYLNGTSTLSTGGPGLTMLIGDTTYNLAGGGAAGGSYMGSNNPNTNINLGASIGGGGSGGYTRGSYGDQGGNGQTNTGGGGGGGGGAQVTTGPGIGGNGGGGVIIIYY